MSDRALVSTRKGLFVLQNSKNGWGVTETAFMGTPVTMAMHDEPDGAIYAALKHGHFGPKLHRSGDGGKTWSEIATPAFPTDAIGAPTLKQIWILAAGHKSQSGRIWAGAIPAGLFRSDDRGKTWTFVSSLWNVPERAQWFGGGYDEAGIHSIVSDPRDPNRLIVAVSSGGVWETRDDGRTWTVRCEGLIARYMPPEKQRDSAIQDPHRVRHAPSSPDVLWMQHHNGVFRSTDGGKHWSELNPAVSNFGFAVAVHPKQPDTAWLVPAIADEMRVPKDGQLCVTRTDDGGRTWTALRNGLPQQNAYDLIYRHGLDVDSSGERLLMGSTTGNLWSSDDGGRNWRSFAGHLPPIYAVSFA
jgi:photosystem II stability/assembly factor-like uncharacterized protein